MRKADDIERRIIAGQIVEHPPLAMGKQHSLSNKGNRICRGLGSNGKAAQGRAADLRMGRRRNGVNARHDIGGGRSVATPKRNRAFDCQAALGIWIPQRIKREPGCAGGLGSPFGASAYARSGIRPECDMRLFAGKRERKQATVKSAIIVWKDTLENFAVMGHGRAGANLQGPRSRSTWRDRRRRMVRV